MGGSWWDAAHTQKATASNAGPVIAAVRLSRRLGDPALLAFAEQVYGYWRGAAVTATHEVADHLDLQGQEIFWRFTYDEGLMVGAALELHRATGKASYLQDARDFAAYLLQNETAPSADGTVLFDGTDARCGGDCAAFKGIAYRYLALLGATDLAGGDPGGLLSNCSNAVWDLARGAGDLLAVDGAQSRRLAVDRAR